MNREELDAAIVESEARLEEAREQSVTARHRALNESMAAKSAMLADLNARTDPATGQVLAERPELPAVQPSPLREASPQALREALSAIEGRSRSRAGI